MTPATKAIAYYVYDAFMAWKMANAVLSPTADDYNLDSLYKFLNKSLLRHNCDTFYYDLYTDKTKKSTLKDGEIYWHWIPHPELEEEKYLKCLAEFPSFFRGEF